MRSTTRKSLKKLSHREDLHIDNVMNEPVIGNFLGLNIVHTIASRLDELEKKFSLGQEKTASQKKELDELEKKFSSGQEKTASQKKELDELEKKFSSGQEKTASQKKELDELKKKFSSGQEKTASQKKELDELREKVLDLEKPPEGYKLLRNRFMTHFNRYYLGKFDNWDKNIVLAGNIAAHQSDIKVDAMLYLSPGPGRQQRKDPDAFQALYGVQPQLIPEISE